MQREFRFPRRIKHEHVSFRLVLARRIPDHPKVAIYRSMPIFSKGKLVEDYLVMAPGGQLLATETSFAAALATLFRLQDSLRQRPARPRRPLPPKLLGRLKDGAEKPHPTDLPERQPKACSGG